MEGVVNVVSPAPVRNTDFMLTLREVKNIPFGIPISTLLLKLGAKLIGTETELVLKSRNVIPQRLQENGFKFIYGDIEKAMGKL